jgi:hypothetical protein
VLSWSEILRRLDRTTTMTINQLLDRVLGLTQHVEDRKAECPVAGWKEECLELATLIGKLSERVGRGELPDRWKQAVPWLSPMRRYECNLGIMDKSEAWHVKVALGVAVISEWNRAGELAGLARITREDAAHVIHAATLDRIAGMKD